MKYNFRYQVAALDSWRLSMYQTYHSLAGACNVVFTAAAIVLTLRFGHQTQPFITALLILSCLWFPVIQPVLIYQQARKRVKTLPDHMELSFEQRGVHVVTPREDSWMSWEKIREVIEVPHMIVLLSNGSHGFMLPDRMLGDRKTEVLAFLHDMIKK